MTAAARPPGTTAALGGWNRLLFALELGELLIISERTVRACWRT